MTDIKKCSLCGMCKENCPVFKIMLKEKHSPRGKIMMIKEDMINDFFYMCTMCGACKQSCPSDVKIEIRTIRKELLRQGKETKANRHMIENIRKHGNPFGEVKEGVEPKDLYCC